MAKNTPLLAALALLPLLAHAQTYKCIDERGKVRYAAQSGPGCKLVPGTAPRAAPSPPPQAKGAAKAPAKAAKAAPSKSPAAITAQERARRASECRTMQEQLDWLNGPRGEGIENRAARIAQVKDGMRGCP